MIPDAKLIDILRKHIKERHDRFIKNLCNEEKCKTIEDFIKIQQGLISNKKLLLKIEEITKEE